MREAVYRYLADRPDGAEAGELIEILFPEGAENNDFGRVFLQRLLAGDPRVEPCGGGRWRPAVHHLFSIPIADVPFVVVDLEATGDSDSGSAGSGVTEVGAVRLQGRAEIGRFERLVNPGSRIPPYVEKLTGITNSMVKDAPPLEDVIGPFYDFAQGAVLVAHNAAFDYAILDRAVWDVLHRPLDCPSLCTIDLVRYAFPDLQRTALDWLAEHFRIDRSTRHRAVADAELTGEILYRALEKLAERGVRTLGDLAVSSGDPLASARLRVGITQSRLESLPAGTGVFRLLDEQGVTLLVGRAADVRERVVQLYLNADRLGSRQLEMMTLTRDVEATAVGSQLEALLEEASQIRLCDPQFQRGGKHVPRLFFVKLSANASGPRVMVASRVSADGALYLGPIKNREFAEQVVATLASVFEVELGSPAIGPRAGKKDDARPRGGSTSGADELRRLMADGPEALIRGVLARADGNDAGKRVSRVLRRLAKVDQRTDWLVSRHDYLVVLPSVDEDGRVAVVVRGGRFQGMRRLRNSRDLSPIRKILEGENGAPSSRQSRAAQADAASIMVSWLRSSHREAHARVIRLRDRETVVPTDTAMAELASMLEE